MFIFPEEDLPITALPYFTLLCADLSQLSSTMDSRTIPTQLCPQWNWKMYGAYNDWTLKSHRPGRPPGLGIAK